MKIYYLYQGRLPGMGGAGLYIQLERMQVCTVQ